MQCDRAYDPAAGGLHRHTRITGRNAAEVDMVHNGHAADIRPDDVKLISLRPASRGTWPPWPGS
jgi:hypothetical protein